jgi:hypothetical protein
VESAPALNFGPAQPGYRVSADAAEAGFNLQKSLAKAYSRHPFLSVRF